MDGPSKVASVDKSTIDVIARCTQLVHDGKGPALLEEIEKLTDPEQITAHSWELIPLLCQSLHKDANSLFLKVCQHCLMHIVKNGGAKEVLLAVLDQADRFKDDIAFFTIIDLLQVILRRLSGTNQWKHAIKMALPVMYAHVKSIPPPKNFQIETRKEKNVFIEGDKTFERSAHVVSTCVDFADALIQSGLKTIDWKNELSSLESECVLIFLVKLLEHPLVFMDLSLDDSASSYVHRKNAERIAAMLGNLSLNLMLIIEKLCKKQLPRADEWSDVSSLGSACIAYLILSESMQPNHVPSVYSNFYLLEFAIPHSLALMKQEEIFAREKGVRLLRHVILLQPENSIAVSSLQEGTFRDIPRWLVAVMTTCGAKYIQQMAVTCMSTVIGRLDVAGKYRLFTFIFATVTHSGVLGYFIDRLKDQVHRTGSSDGRSASGPVEEVSGSEKSGLFGGSSLEALTRTAVRLPDGSETDILANLDRIMSGLNLVRYLQLTSRCDDWTWLDTDLLDPLKFGLDITRAHYRLAAAEGAGIPDLEVEVAAGSGDRKRKTRAEVTKRQHRAMVESACHTLDLIESVWGRVCDIRKNKVTRPL